MDLASGNHTLDVSLRSLLEQVVAEMQFNFTCWDPLHVSTGVLRSNLTAYRMQLLHSMD